MTPNKPQMSRCPACNPMHASKGSMMPARGKKLQACLVCKNTRLIPVEAAKAAVEHINGYKPE